MCPCRRRHSPTVHIVWDGCGDVFVSVLFADDEWEAAAQSTDELLLDSSSNWRHG